MLRKILNIKLRTKQKKEIETPKNLFFKAYCAVKKAHKVHKIIKYIRNQILSLLCLNVAFAFALLCFSFVAN